MRVTKIERQRHHPQRVNLYLDGEFALGLHADVLVKAGIRLGDRLDTSTIALLRTHEEATLARNAALRLLMHRMRTEKELRLSLIEKEFDPSVVDNVIHELQMRGIVDDRKFAEAFIHDARLRRPAGKIMLYHKLRQHGVGRDLIRETLDENLPVDKEQELAYATAMSVLKRFRSSRKAVPPDLEQRKVAQYLLRRGFTAATIAPVIRKIFSSKQERG